MLHDRHVRDVDPEESDDPPDGRFAGAIILYGNMYMPGYYEDETATQATFAVGELHTYDTQSAVLMSMLRSWVDRRT
jgi:long-subunit acyl-CoA synthetase (AMP-forming)